MKVNDLFSKELISLNYMLGLIVAKVLQNNNYNIIISDVNVIEEGFYVEFDYEFNLKEEDLKNINNQIQFFLKTKFNFLQEKKSKKELLKLNNNIFLIEQLKKIEFDNIDTIILNGSYFIKKQEILNEIPKNISIICNSISGAYFQGQSENKQLQRIYGIGHFSKEQLQQWIEEIEIRKNYDHRKIGQELEIFMFDILSGACLLYTSPSPRDCS